MPRKENLHKVMVIGSGPIVIGQAAEFDYAGSQACRALKEDDLEVVLVNSNPATIMTDTNIADRVYIEPLTLDFLTEIIAKEKPDGLLATLGGQAGLNLAVQLAEYGILEKYGVDRSKVTYIPNFVSRETFYKITDQSKADLRKKFGLNPDKFTVVSAGQLQMRKGVLEFIDLATKMPDIQFVWAGNFAFKGISEGRKEIMEHMDDLPDNVHVLGLVERDRMNEFFNMGDVMLQLSFEELFPMTILESMNANIPLLLRDLPEYKPILFTTVNLLVW